MEGWSTTRGRHFPRGPSGTTGSSTPRTRTMSDPDREFYVYAVPDHGEPNQYWSRLCSSSILSIFFLFINFLSWKRSKTREPNYSTAPGSQGTEPGWGGGVGGTVRSGSSILCRCSSGSWRTKSLLNQILIKFNFKHFLLFYQLSFLKRVVNSESLFSLTTAMCLFFNKTYCYVGYPFLHCCWIWR